jgi:hypothetical protein
MRDFLSMRNLLQAMALSAVVTATSSPWILRAGMWPGLLIPSSFVLMTFVCGFVTAWGTSAGMPGIVTDRRTLVRGIIAAALLSLVVIPIQVFITDPILYNALLGSAKPSAVNHAFPAAFGDRLALLLWGAGFQTMFLEAAPMSFFARLAKRQHLAVGFCLVFRAYVAHLQIAQQGMTDAVPLFLVSNILVGAAGCILFARCGLLPTILLSVGTSLHLFAPQIQH